jgi:integrase
MDAHMATINPPTASTTKGGRTISDAIQEWRKQETGHLKPSTMRAKSHIKHHIEPVLWNLPTEDMSSTVVQQFVNSRTGVRRKTIVNIMQTVLSIAKVAQRPLKWADLKLPYPEAPSEVGFLSAEGVRQIINRAKEPYNTMFATVGMTGVRGGEMLGLQYEDLDFTRKVIHIQRTLDSRTKTAHATKTEGSKTEVPMPPQLEARLMAYLRTRKRTEPFLFTNRNGNPYAIGKVVEYGLWPTQDKLGIPRTGLHASRHGLASELLDRGAPLSVVQRQLRHRDAKTTLRYAHVVGDVQRRAVANYASQLEPNA